MLSLIIALIIVFSLFTYWYKCNINGIKKQKELVEQLELYYEDNDVSHKDKFIAHKFYLIFRQWWAFPVLILIIPFLIITSLFSKKNKAEMKKVISINEIKRNDKSKDMTKKIFEMYIIRNPIVATCSLILLLLVMLLWFFIGLILNQTPSAEKFTTIIRSAGEKILTNHSR